MSERNTALLLPGHVPGPEIVERLLQIPELSPSDLQGDEAPRVGHGSRDGRDYTFVGLRLFELGGLLLFDRLELPGDDEPEVHLGRSLSASLGTAVFVFYDEENAVGGHAVFRGGMLTERDAVDGRWDEPMRRGLDSETVLADLDASDWIWPALADAVDAGAAVIVGPGVRDDDGIEALINASNPTRVGPTTPAAEAPPKAPKAPKARKRDRMKAGLRKLLKR
jgi:hypothetical protein